MELTHFFLLRAALAATKESRRGVDALGKSPKPAGSPQNHPVRSPKLPILVPNSPKIAQFGAGPGRLEAPRVFLKDLGAFGKGNLGPRKAKGAGKAKSTPRGWGNSGEKVEKHGKTRGNMGKQGETPGKNWGKMGGKGQSTYREERGVGGESEFDAVVIKVRIAAGPGHAGGSARLIPGWN